MRETVVGDFGPAQPQFSQLLESPEVSETGVGHRSVAKVELQQLRQGLEALEAVIVHAGADDLESQPTGAAGPRVACGVIVAHDGGSGTR